MKPLFQTVGDIRKGNSLYAHEDTSAFDVATELIGSRYTGMPVVDKANRVIGMVSEQDILNALRGTIPLEKIVIKDIMTRSPKVIKEETTLEEARKILEDLSVHRLPVVKGDVLTGTLTRHDLLRAWIGLPVEIG